METCGKCGIAYGIGDWPWCPHGKPGTNFYAPDDIPGGIVIENLGPTPVRVYSHSERRAIMRSRGLEECVRHVPLQGSDKSPHTLDWSKGSIDAKTLENAKVLVSRDRSKTVSDPELSDHVVTSDGRVVRLSPGRIYRGLLDAEE